MSANNEFVGTLMTFDKKGEGEEIIHDNVFVEVSEFTNDGLVEICFTDRNERCYLKFPLPELLRHVALLVGNKP